MHDMHLSGIDLNLLPVVAALVDEANVTRAAKRLGLSQSAMSHALGRARSAFDDPLLVRSGRSMVPTPRAQALASAVRSGLATIANTLSDGRGFDARRARRTFTLLMTDYVEVVLLPPLLARLREEAPHVDLWVLQSLDPYGALLAAGSVDLAFNPIYAGESADLHHESLFEDGFVCVMRRGHPLARQKLDLDRFCAASHLLIAPRGLRGGSVDDALALLGRSRRVALAVPQFLAAPHLVASSDLVVTMASRLAGRFTEPLALVVRPPPLALGSFTVAQVWHERMAHDPGLGWLRALVRDVARSLGPVPEVARRELPQNETTSGRSVGKAKAMRSRPSPRTAR